MNEIWKNITNNEYFIYDGNLTIYSKICIARFAYKNDTNFTHLCHDFAPTLIGTVKETCDSCNRFDDCWYAFYKYDLTLKICNNCFGYNYEMNKISHIEFNGKNIYLLNNIKINKETTLDGLLFEKGFVYHLIRRIININKIPIFKDCIITDYYIDCDLCNKNERGYMISYLNQENEPKKYLCSNCHKTTLAIFIRKYIHFMYIYHVDDIRYVKDICDTIMSVAIQKILE